MSQSLRRHGRRNAWGPGVAEARLDFASTEDPMLRWADDPQLLDTVGACDLDSATSDEPALLSEQVGVLIHQTERATRLAALQTLGQQVYALSWTCSQRSAFWALWQARGQAVREDTERRVACVRKAVATIRQAGPQLPSLGTRRFAFANAEPMFSPEKGWALWCIREPAPRM